MKTKYSKIIPLALSLSVAQGATIGLFEWAVNIDGTVSNPTLGDSLPAGVDVSAFNASTGLGTVTVTTTGLGSHYSALFVDHEIDESINTFFNEVGATSGAAAAGQSWEIDEPGFTFGDIYGNLVASNFAASSLDNSNGVPDTNPDDVSMAIGWNYTLEADEIAVASFELSESAPNSGFYLRHTDPRSQSSVYFSSRLRISDDSQGGTNPNPSVPEGGLTLTLMMIGLVGVGALKLVSRQTQE